MIKPYDFPVCPDVYTEHADIGIFDKLYEIECIDRTQRDTLAKWLCHNCTENFIFAELTSRIIAGGTTDLKTSWSYRSKLNDELKSYQLKLHEPDIMLFEMCWLTGPNGLLYS